jgi:hypothetical protein
MESVPLPRGIRRIGNKFRAESTRQGPLRNTVAQAKKDLAVLRRGLLLSVSNQTREERRREVKRRGKKTGDENRRGEMR